jgi:hypothetical protein
LPVRAVARWAGRSASAISRELARNACLQPTNVDLVQSDVTLLHIHDYLKGMPGLGG